MNPCSLQYGLKDDFSVGMIVRQRPLFLEAWDIVENESELKQPRSLNWLLLLLNFQGTKGREKKRTS